MVCDPGIARNGICCTYIVITDPPSTYDKLVSLRQKKTRIRVGGGRTATHCLHRLNMMIIWRTHQMGQAPCPLHLLLQVHQVAVAAIVAVIVTVIMRRQGGGGGPPPSTDPKIVAHNNVLCRRQRRRRFCFRHTAGGNFFVPLYVSVLKILRISWRIQKWQKSTKKDFDPDPASNRPPGRTLADGSVFER